MVDRLGVYLHIPFCQSKCHYCDFVSGLFPGDLINPYVEALRKEIQRTDAILQATQIDPGLIVQARLDSIYLGGGTPSYIEARQILELIHTLRSAFDFVADVEVTLEVNPGSVDFDKIRQYQEAGVNRVSIGIQAFQEHLLKIMGRSHSVEDGIATIRLFRQAGFRNLSVDVMAGLPGQSLEDWQDTLRMVRLLSPEHISIYLLELHENTAFGRFYSHPDWGARSTTGILALPALPTEELVEHFYLEAVQQLSSAGYLHYEISNFARPGHQSRHNLKYWTNQPFLGFGCSAFSYLEKKRWGNEKNPWKYVERINQDCQAVDCLFPLNEQEVQEEAIFLGLRLIRGLDVHDFKARFGLDFQEHFSNPISYLQSGGLLECDADRVRLTPSGCLLSNEVFTEFLT